MVAAFGDAAEGGLHRVETQCRSSFYLLLNGGVIFLVFTLMVTKLPHYTLPAFPFLALCLRVALERGWTLAAPPDCSSDGAWASRFFSSR